MDRYNQMRSTIPIMDHVNVTADVLSGALTANIVKFMPNYTGYKDINDNVRDNISYNARIDLIEGVMESVNTFVVGNSSLPGYDPLKSQECLEAMLEIIHNFLG